MALTMLAIRPYCVECSNRQDTTVYLNYENTSAPGFPPRIYFDCPQCHIVIGVDIVERQV